MMFFDLLNNLASFLDYINEIYINKKTQSFYHYLFKKYFNS